MLKFICHCQIAIKILLEVVVQFTSFEVLDAEEDELQFLYPEMKEFIGKCKYDNCRHIKEPDCAVRNAVSEGKINKERYRSYVTQLLEIREREKNKY